MWTQFWDMHSGGKQKLDWHYIYIEAEKYEAMDLFEKYFDRDPHNITCECCGSDYTIESQESLHKLTAFHRNCTFSEKEKTWLEGNNDPESRGRRYLTLEEYMIQCKEVLFISREDIEREFGIREKA